MAEINLGAIKFNWKGAYAAGTAYVVDDVVSYNGSSYVCILASTGNLPTDTTYWNVMAEGGDVATVLTTQGDVLYRDASGLQRLGAGTSGQVLQTGGTGANPSWIDSSGGLLMTDIATTTTSTSLNSVSFTDIASLTFTKTPASTSSKFFVLANVQVSLTDNSGIGLRIVKSIGGGSFSDVISHHVNTATYVNSSDSGINMRNVIAINGIDSPNTTSSIVYKVQVSADNNITIQNGGASSTFSIMEVSV